MRPPNQSGLPMLPEAYVLEAIRRLELSGPQESDDLGPSVGAGVSGRTVSAGGPLVSPPLRELGLLLDDELVDNLLMLEGPQISIPVEMALDAIADPGVGEPPHSWSGREDLGQRELTATLAPSPPAFLTEWPIRPRTRRARSSFPWDLLGEDGRKSADRRREGPPAEARPQDLSATAGLEEEVTVAAGTRLAPSAGARWTAAGVDASDRRSITDEPLTSMDERRDRRRDDAERAITRARRSPAPVTAALASLVFPGWGQALNEERRKAAAFRLAYLVTLFLAATLAWKGPIGRLAASLMSADPAPAFTWLGTGFSVGAGLWLLAIYDALVVRSSQRR